MIICAAQRNLFKLLQNINVMHKQLFLLLIFSSFIFAAAPNWIKKDVRVQYTATPGGTVSYKITERTSSSITLDLNPGTTTNDPTTDSGSFWYDSAKTASANIADSIDGWTVMDKDITVTAAGKDWTTIKLRKTVGGLQTDRYVDEQTGLLIKHENSAQSVTLSSYTAQFSNTPPPTPNPAPGPSPNPSPSPSPNPSPSPSPSPQPPPSLTPSPSPGSAPPSNQTAPNPAPAPVSAPDLKPPDSSVPCCPVAFLLLVLGLVVYKQKN